MKFRGVCKSVDASFKKLINLLNIKKMNIYLKMSYGYILIVEDTNVKIEEDIESREYPKDENGKNVFNLNPKRDIKTSALDDISILLSDMIYHRTEDYNSSDLIKLLFKKLPDDIRIKTITDINSDYL